MISLISKRKQRKDSMAYLLEFWERAGSLLLLPQYRNWVTSHVESPSQEFDSLVTNNALI